MASNEESSSVRFHRKCGHLITLSPCGRTAFRNYANQEFNHGLVMSSSPLQEDQLFEVRLDKKINSWSGSIEVVRIFFDRLQTTSKSCKSSKHFSSRESSRVIQMNLKSHCHQVPQKLEMERGCCREILF